MCASACRWRWRGARTSSCGAATGRRRRRTSSSRCARPLLLLSLSLARAVRAVCAGAGLHNKSGLLLDSVAEGGASAQRASVRPPSCGQANKRFAAGLPHCPWVGRGPAGGAAAGAAPGVAGRQRGAAAHPRGGAAGQAPGAAQRPVGPALHLGHLWARAPGQCGPWCASAVRVPAGGFACSCGKAHQNSAMQSSCSKRRTERADATLSARVWMRPCHPQLPQLWDDFKRHVVAAWLPGGLYDTKSVRCARSPCMAGARLAQRGAALPPGPSIRWIGQRSGRTARCARVGRCLIACSAPHDQSRWLV